jgi:hypothetical protein
MKRFTIQLQGNIVAPPVSEPDTTPVDYDIPFKITDLIPEWYRNHNFNLLTTVVIPNQKWDDTTSDTAGHVVSLANLTTPFTQGTRKIEGSQLFSGSDAALVLGFTKPSVNGTTTTTPYTVCQMRIDTSDCIQHTIKYPQTDSLVLRIRPMLLATIQATFDFYVTLQFEPIE